MVAQKGTRSRRSNPRFGCILISLCWAFALRVSFVTLRTCVNVLVKGKRSLRRSPVKKYTRLVAAARLLMFRLLAKAVSVVNVFFSCLFCRITGSVSH